MDEKPLSLLTTPSDPYPELAHFIYDKHGIRCRIEPCILHPPNKYKKSCEPIPENVQRRST